MRSIRTRPVRGHYLRSALLVIFTVLVVLPLASTEARFLLCSAWEEARILLARRPLRELIADPATTAQRRGQFELVLAARTFAAERLGLAAKDTYTTFSDMGEGKSLLTVISASPKDSLTGYRWSYPVVGAIPYKGFFDEQAAEAEKRRLESLGYDTYLRPSGAFSTLGWFNDPLLSTALDDDPVEVVVTVIHEIAHNTLWVPGDARFNESYANFVGFRGAELFFASRGDQEAARHCAALWRDEKRLGAFYTELEADLQRLYGSGLPRPEIERRRTEIFAQARARLAGPLDREMEVYSGARLARTPINNARVIAKRIYLTGLDELDKVYSLHGGDLRAGIKEIERSLKHNRSRPALEVLALMARSGSVARSAG
ncbi:MAG TPA: aminopeptidase [Thermoanaerobaculia bacterium]|nr:aminopeptidase [Thermoanaerobaculia bacterium]